MAKQKCTLTKATKGMQATSVPKMSANDPAPPEIQLLVDAAGTGLTVFAVRQSGEKVDPSSVATLTAAAGDPTILVVGAIAGSHVAYTPGKVGKTTLVLTETWNDPSAGIGPFTYTVPATIADDPITGLAVVLDPAVVVGP